MTSSRRDRPGPCAGRVVPSAGLALAAAVSLAACTPEPGVGGPLPFSRAGTGTYLALSQQIFVPRCATGSCHGGSPPPVSPRLDAAAGWAALVNVPSQEDVMDLVEPGAPDQSWLLIRLRGEGGRAYMPLGDAQLTQEEIAAVEGWIADGALND